MSTSNNAKKVSEKIYAKLTGAVVDTAILNGVIINGYSFTLTDKTERNGIQRFEKGMIVDLNAYLSPNKNTLYLNSVCLSESNKSADSKPASSDGTVRNLSSAAVTAMTDKSVSLDGTEYFFSRHTEKAVEPVVGLVVDAVIYETARGRMYLNSMHEAVCDSVQTEATDAQANSSNTADPDSSCSGQGFDAESDVKASESSQQPARKWTGHSSNDRKSSTAGVISSVSPKGIFVGGKWYTRTQYSHVDADVRLEKGETVNIIFTKSAKSPLNFINKLSLVQESVNA